jgi:hypothetical protein
VRLLCRAEPTAPGKLNAAKHVAPRAPRVESSNEAEVQDPRFYAEAFPYDYGMVNVRF